MKYTVIIEQGESSFGVYIPDLPGCMAAGETKDEALSIIKDAMEFHLEGMIERGDSIPKPHCFSELVDVNAA